MSDVLISASSLKRCGWARVLGKKRKPSARAVVAMGKGNGFHGVTEEFVKTSRLRASGDPQVDEWIDGLLSQWRPPPGTLVEVAMGLGPGGVYVPVTEILPHVYVPDAGLTTPILTGGRADVVIPEPTIVTVGDWKTGAYEPEDPNTNLQLNSLGMAAAKRWGVGAYRTWLYMAQDARFVHGDPVRVGSKEWDARLADVTAAATVGEEPRPGHNCINCWERRSCQFAQEEAA
jgi:hypothetical protein